MNDNFLHLGTRYLLFGAICSNIMTEIIMDWQHWQHFSSLSSANFLRKIGGKKLVLKKVHNNVDFKHIISIENLKTNTNTITTWSNCYQSSPNVQTFFVLPSILNILIMFYLYVHMYKIEVLIFFFCRSSNSYQDQHRGGQMGGGAGGNRPPSARDERKSSEKVSPLPPLSAEEKAERRKSSEMNRSPAEAEAGGGGLPQRDSRRKPEKSKVQHFCVWKKRTV